MSGMLGILIKEFIAVCEFLERDPAKVRDDILVVRKEDLKALLDKNKYETATRKLKYWKSLRWIRTDGRRLTKRIYDGQKKRYVPYIEIERKVFQHMKMLTK